MGQDIRNSVARLRGADDHESPWILRHGRRGGHRRLQQERDGFVVHVAHGKLPGAASAKDEIEVLRDIWAEKTAGYDAVLLPTSPILPPNAERLMTDNDYYVTENLLALRNTRIGNMFDQSVLTLPTNQPSCGISIMCGPHNEERLLRIGMAAERALA